MCSMRVLRCLCPPASRPYIRPKARAAFLRFYSASRPCIRPTARAACLRFYSDETTVPRPPVWNPDKSEKWQHKELYPRIKRQDRAIDFQTFKERYKSLGRGESKPDDEVVVRGMSVHSSVVKLAHVVKEEYGRLGLQVQSWDF